MPNQNEVPRWSPTLEQNMDSLDDRFNSRDPTVTRTHEILAIVSAHRHVSSVTALCAQVLLYGALFGCALGALDSGWRSTVSAEAVFGPGPLHSPYLGPRVG